MARQPRFTLPNQPQHVIQRGNNRSAIFCAPKDYHFFLDKLQQAASEHGCDIHAYVLMTNHVHLLATPQQTDGLSKMMQSLGRCYVQHFNHRYQRTGTLWEGRYRATLIDSENYLFTCMRYIELNPVRAGMLRLPRDYPWSSHSYNAFGIANPLLTRHSLFQQLGQNDKERHAAYRALFQKPVSEQTLADIRDATNKAWVLGNDRFKRDIIQLLERQAEPIRRGGDHCSSGFREIKSNRV